MEFVCPILKQMPNTKAELTVMILFFLVCSPMTVVAATYYIDSTNGDDTAPGVSPSTAWRTLDKLHNTWDEITAGDAVLLKRGETYTRAGCRGVVNPPADKAGAPDHYIIVGAYGTGDRPVIDAGNAYNQRALCIHAASYLIFQDIEFQGVIQLLSATSSGTHHLKFLRIVLDGANCGGYFQAGDTAQEVAPEVWIHNPMHHIEIDHSVFRNTTDYDAVNFKAIDGDIWFHHNQVFNSTGGECLDFGEGDNITVEYNVFSGVVAKKNGVKLQCQTGTLDNLTFRGNLIVGTAYGIIIYNATNSQIYNNTIIANLETPQGHSHAAFLGWGTSSPVYHCGLGTTGFDNNKIYNNIFYGIVNIMIPRDVQITYKDGTSINYSQGDLWEDNAFKNNIIYHPKYSADRIIRLIEYTTGTHVYWDGIGWDGNYGNTAVLLHGLSHYLDLENQWNCHPAISDLNADPLFVEPLWTAPENYGDWNLQADSVAVNRGIPVAGYAYDLSGNEIQDNPDIGAF